MAWECRHSGDLHTCDDGVLVEVLRDGRPAEPGERGEVVVTNLHAYAMPFIRYRIGDLATRGAPCGCGAPFSTIGEITGTDDRLLPAAPTAVCWTPTRSWAVWRGGPREWMQAVPAGAGAARPCGALRGGRRAAVRRAGARRSSASRAPFWATAWSSRCWWAGRIPIEPSGKLRPPLLAGSLRATDPVAPDRARSGRRGPGPPAACTAAMRRCSTSIAWAHCARCRASPKSSPASTGIPSARCCSPGEGDAVCVPHPVDPAYLGFLARTRAGPASGARHRRRRKRARRGAPARRAAAGRAGQS